MDMFCCLSAMLSSMQAPPPLQCWLRSKNLAGLTEQSITKYLRYWILKDLVSYQPFASCLMSLCKVPVEAKARYNQAWYELWSQPLAYSLTFVVAKTCSHCFFTTTTQSKAALLWVWGNFGNLQAVFWNLRVSKTVWPLGYQINHRAMNKRRFHLNCHWGFDSIWSRINIFSYLQTLYKSLL